MKKSKILYVALISLVLWGCKKPEDKQDTVPSYNGGLVVVNEGNFGSSNGSVGYLNGTTYTADIFSAANGRPLGDVVQSAYTYSGKMYIVVNNTNKVEVVDAINIKSLYAISNLALPRYIAVSGGKTFITEWVSFSGAGRVRVVDAGTGTGSTTITVGTLPERLWAEGNKLYVCNSGDTSITVIDIAADTVLKTLDLDWGVNSIVKAANGKLYAATSGKWLPDYSALEVKGKIFSIDPTTDAVTEEHEFTSNFSGASGISTNSAGTQLYFAHSGAVYTTSTSSISPVSFASKSPYGFSIDPETDDVYVANANGFVAASTVYRYNATGTLLDSVTTGIGTNSLVRNE